MRKLGILGSGDVGQALGRGFSKAGWAVMLGSREPGSAALKAWTASTPRASTGTFAQAAAHGEVLVVAVRGNAAEAVAKSVGPASFAGKLVLDATNPLDMGAGPGLFVGTNDSLAERLQRLLPEARIVKCFNTVSSLHMAMPRFTEGTPPMLVAGNDAAAKQRTEEMVKELGWPGILDCGALQSARWLEALVPLWVQVGKRLDTWGHAFKVVR